MSQGPAGPRMFVAIMRGATPNHLHLRQRLVVLVAEHGAQPPAFRRRPVRLTPASSGPA